MQIRMQNAEVLTREQIAEFLKGSEGIEFRGQNRAEQYGGVQRVVVGRGCAVQEKQQGGGMRGSRTGRRRPAGKQPQHELSCQAGKAPDRRRIRITIRMLRMGAS